MLNERERIKNEKNKKIKNAVRDKWNSLSKLALKYT